MKNEMAKIFSFRNIKNFKFERTIIVTKQSFEEGFLSNVEAEIFPFWNMKKLEV